MRENVLRRVFLPLLCLVLLCALMPDALAAGSDPEGARKVILQAYEDLAAAEGLSHTVDLERFAITKEELNEIVESTDLYHEGLQPWYLENYEYTYTDIVCTVTFNRKDPAVYDYDLFERRMAEILAATVHEGMSDWQMALSIHDYLVVNCTYDESLTYREGYDMIVRGTAVCSGYAEAFMYLLNRVGIGCRYVSSEEMDHAWNLVQIGGSWYHVDATWADPTSNVQGRVMHNNFLLSDQAIQEQGHYGWVADIECTDISLDSGCFWQGIESRICYESADICYFREKTGDAGYTVYRRDGAGEQTVVISWESGYIDIGGSEEYVYFYGSHGLDLVGDTLYYADMTAVYSVKTDGSDPKTVYSHDYEANRTYILGSCVSGDKLYLTLSDHDGNRSAMELSLNDETHVHSYVGQEIAPTCTEAGYTYYQCECGVGYPARQVPMKAHAYDDGVIISEPTLIMTGSKQYTCTDCGQIKIEQLPKLTVEGNNVLTDDDGVDEGEYIIRRVIVGVGIVILGALFRRKKKK